MRFVCPDRGVNVPIDVLGPRCAPDLSTVRYHRLWPRACEPPTVSSLVSGRPPPAHAAAIQRFGSFARAAGRGASRACDPRRLSKDEIAALASRRGLPRSDRMRRTCLALALVAITAAPALAKDSTWLVCKGVAEHGAASNTSKTYFIANVLEHRAANGSDRELRVTLIYGDRVSRGTVANAEPNKAGKLETRAVDGTRGVIFS